MSIKFEPFRYWVQHTLPAVYDDSLSYGELLNKVIWQLNNVMNVTQEAFNNLEDDEEKFKENLLERQTEFENTINTTNDNFQNEIKEEQKEFKEGIIAGQNNFYNSVNNTVNEYINKYNELKTYVYNYFDNLDVQEEINNKLDEMALDGTLSSLLNPLLPALVQQWLNNNISSGNYPYVLDKSLTQENAAADAKTVGDKFIETDKSFNELYNAPKFIINYIYDQVIVTNGNAQDMSTTGLSGKFSVSDFIEITYFIKNWKINNIYLKENSTICLAFYDKTKNFISYYSDEEGLYNLILNDIGIPNNAVYFRFTKLNDTDVTITNPFMEETTKKIEEQNIKINNIYPSYKYNLTQNILCAGDSVTQGFVTEGTYENPEQIYWLEEKYSYPVQLSKILQQCDIEMKAHTGYNCKQWYDAYIDSDFTKYQLIIMELGYNGNLIASDLNIPGTNTYWYQEIIKKIREQNNDCYIFLTRSSNPEYTKNWPAVLQYISRQNNCSYLDLTNKFYLDLNDVKYHGYYNDNGTVKLDDAHFNIIGYNAKAYVIERLISEQLDG